MTLYFPDVSGYQPGIDLAGALAVAIKATESTWYTSGYYGAQAAEADHHGAYRMAYHFLHAGNGAGQADYCHRIAGKTPLMLDWEPASTTVPGHAHASGFNRRSALSHEPRAVTAVRSASAPKVADACAFIDRYRAIGGTCWWLYFPNWYWQQLGSPSLKPLADRGMLLWSSVYVPYTDANSGRGWQPYGGMTPLAWQYTSTLNFGGHPQVDFSAFRGHYAGKQDDTSVDACLAEFRALTATGKWPAPPADWTYPAPRNPVASGGHTSVALSWQAPAFPGHPAPDHYLVWIYKGTTCTAGTLVPRIPPYPRPVFGTAEQFGGLTRSTVYTAHVSAAGPIVNGKETHVGPGVFASVQFRTG